MSRAHGGNLDWAMATYGVDGPEWIDLSTGINRVPYPVPSLAVEAWTMLPTKSAKEGLIAAAMAAFGATGAGLAVAGAQAAIQMIPRLTRPGLARVLSPTYNEHAGALRAAGWRVQEVGALDQLAGADLAIVVNPNNPDGRRYELAGLLGQVGRLVVDESFADAEPGLSLAGQAGREGLVVLRSFGKFYGLAGLRLGFVMGATGDIAALEAMAGPWPVSGAAIEIGRRALADRDWARETAARLRADARRMDGLAAAARLRLVGGTELFRLYDMADAAAVQARLARGHIWSRVFDYDPRWLRLGLPGSEAEWDRVAEALR